jgi:hypothetical protein
MFKSIKKLFIKETFSCIVWDGKIMRYLTLTQKQIDKMNNQGLTVTKKDEC